MAFTSTQEEQIYQYLGFQAEPDDAPGAATAALRSDLAAKIVEIGSDATKQATVAALLVKIAAVDTALDGSGATGSPGALKKADEVEFYDGTSLIKSGLAMSSLSYGELLVSRLANRFGYMTAQLPSDYFGLRGKSSAGVAGSHRGQPGCDIDPCLLWTI